MSKFVLTAQLQLQAPTNSAQIIAQLRRDLSGLNAPITVTGAAKAKRQIKGVTAATNQAASSAQNMGKSFGLAFKRFAAFTIASRAVSLFTNGLANAVDEAIDFQREMIKISQVTGKTITQLQGLERTIFHLATSLGVSSKELLSTTRVLSQAGIKAKDLDVALAALAKTTLAPTFENIAQTAEGAIAILAQFKQGVGALETQLGSINAVAGQFAVESADIIGAIRRTGGVFREAGGSLTEFIALFTSVRATTRESSESIATGLRTIFTRIQRPKTLEFLRQYGVELTDLEGRFVGPYEAVKRLNKAVGSLEQGDITFIKIAEEIAGFRQIGKVIPLLKEFELAERAKNAAVAGGSSLAEDAAKAQKSLAVQITKVKQEFQELIQGIANSTTFQAFVKTSLDLASALIKVADAIKPLIPLIAGLMAFKLARGLGGFASGLGGALRGAAGKNQGGKILAFARGGMVPGQGNRDTVPAMLQPGEFVMRKSSVNKMGAGSLAAMNSNRYASGGTIKMTDPGQYGAMVLSSGSDIKNAPLTGTAIGHINKEIRKAGIEQKPIAEDKDLKKHAHKMTQKEQKAMGLPVDMRTKKKYEFGSNQKIGRGVRTNLEKSYIKGGGLKLRKGQVLDYKMAGPFPVLGISGNEGLRADMKTEFEDAAATALGAGANSIMTGSLPQILNLGGGLNFGDGKRFRIGDILEGAGPTMEGYILEAVLGSIGDMKTQMGDRKASGVRADFDFPNIVKESRDKLKNVFDPNSGLDGMKKADAKRTRTTAVSGDGRLVNKIAKDLKAGEFTVSQMAKGGSVKDTVPALLTPGEFVLNKSASKSIGYGNLGRMNKSGVAGFNKGGTVGVQRFGEGGGVGAGTAVVVLTALSLANNKLQELGTNADSTKNAFGRVTDVLISWGTAAAAAVFALKQLGFAVSAKGIMEFFGTGPKGLGGMLKGVGSAVKAGAGGGKFVGKNKQLHMGGKFANVGTMAPGMNLKGSSAFGGKTADMLKGVTNLTSGIRSQLLGAKLQVVAILANTKALIMGTKFGKKLGAKASGFGKNFKQGKQFSAPGMSGGQGTGGKLGNMFGRTKSFAGKQQQRLSSFTDDVKGRASSFGKNFKQGKQFTAPGMSGGRGVGGRLGKMASRGGKMMGKLPGGKMLGKVGGKVLGGAARIGASALGASGAGAGLGGLAAAASAAAGPLMAGAAAVALLSAGLNAAFDAQGKYEEAIRSGTVAEAEKYAVLKEVPGIVQLFGSTVSEAYIGLKSMFGGDSVALVKQQAKVAKMAADADKEKTKNARDAAQAMRDLAASSTTATEALQAQTKNFLAQQAVGKEEETAENLKQGGKSGIVGGVGRGALRWLTGGIAGMMGVESGGQRNRRIDKETGESKAKREEKSATEFESLRGSLGPLEKRFILSGASVEEFAEASGLAGNMTKEQAELLNKDYEAHRKAIEANIAFIQSLNFGLRGVSAAADAAAVSMDTVAAAGQAGFNSFEDSAKVLEASVTAAGANIGDATMDGAIEDLEGSMRKFGASDKQVDQATGTIKGLRTAQGNTGAALEAAKEKLAEGQDVSPQEIKKALGTELLKGVEGPAKEKLAAAIENMKIDEEMRLAIAAGDLDKVLEKTLDPVAKAASEQALSLLKKRAELENKLITSIQNRQKQEQEYIAAQKGAIETQLEAGKLFESFGGAKLTSGDKLGARVGQANLDLKNAGIGGLGGGSAREIKTALADIRSSSASQNDRANAAVMGKARGLNVPGAFEGAQGMDDDKRDELKTANKALVTFTKQRITLIQEELKIAQQKNKAEKDSLDKLLGGDIEGFLEGQLAAAAGTALKMGDAGAASSLGAGALGAGFKTLEGQGLSDRVMQNAASLSLSSVGVTDPRAAEVMAGTTAEEESLKSEGRELSQILGDAAQQGADLEQMDVNATNVVINASKIAMNQSEVPEGFYKGGPVYANRGMFVSRGTDTVPAMLTPGEFVVNRASVSAGNNLSILRSMNGGAGGMSGMGMSRGGMAYMAGGGLMGKVSAMMVKMATLGTVDLNKSDAGDALQDFENAGNAIKENIIDPMKKILNDPTGLKGVFNQFDQSVQKLIDFQLHVKVDPTNVTVNFQGSSFLAGLKDDIRNELIEKVREELKGAKFNESGDLESKPGGMP